MALHEVIKNVKIIDELLIYLVEKGYTSISFDLNMNQDNTIIKARITSPSSDLISKLKNDIYVERDYELEEYGWELIGEDDKADELQQLGMLIDEIKLEEKDNVLEIILIRKIY